MFCFVWDITSSHSIEVALRFSLPFSFSFSFFSFLFPSFFFFFVCSGQSYARIFLFLWEYGKLLSQEVRFVLFCLGYYPFSLNRSGPQIFFSFFLFFCFLPSFFYSLFCLFVCCLFVCFGQSYARIFLFLWEYGKLLRQEVRFVLFCLGYYLFSLNRSGPQIFFLSFFLSSISFLLFRPILCPYFSFSVGIWEVIEPRGQVCFVLFGISLFSLNRSGPQISLSLFSFLFSL